MNSSVSRTVLAVLLLQFGELGDSVVASERLEPTAGCFLGFHSDSSDTITRLGSRLGITPAVFGRFFDFPLSASDRQDLTNFLNEVLLNGAMAMITLEPKQGLDSVLPADCVDLGTMCAAYEQIGMDGIIVRFGHEMNGNWYVWGQQPLLYKQKFRLLAQNIHSSTSRTAMLWAPSYGVGYPFGTPRAVPGTPDFLALDTDGDGVLTPADDMYEPYYPGDDVVDWVGLTLYHWGLTYPWFKNEMPEPNSFAGSLVGTYQGLTPNFYARYSADGARNKPMAIAETAAFYNTEQPGPGEFNLKQAWWQQVFKIGGDSPAALDLALHFPKLKCIAWFDQYKQEAEAKSSWIDWRVSADQRIRTAFVADVRKSPNGLPYFLTAQEAHWQHSAYAITASNLPRILPLSGSVSVSLKAKAQTNCDLVIDLLDTNYQWQGGTRVAITTRTQAITTAFALVQGLHDGSQYRWSIFLTPTGRSYQQALSWYKGPQPVARMLSPAIEISSFPPVIVAGSNFNVRVKYVASEFSFLLVNLLDEASRSIGAGAVQVPRGDGRLDVPVTLTANPSIRTVWAQALLSSSPQNSQAAMARSSKLPVLIKPSIDVDLITAAVEPSVIPVGEVLRFEVSYAASADRDLHVDLFDAESNYIASAAQPVPSGSGVCDMTISFPRAAPGEYFISSFMTPPGQTLAEAVAWSPQRRVVIIATDYQQWAESFWGVLLQNDPIDPQADPDGDGASNAYEFITQTDPREAQSVLKVSLSRTSTGLKVSWPSVSGHAYQLLESASLSGGAWSLVGAPIVGNGSSLEVSVTPKNTQTFYRVRLVN